MSQRKGMTDMTLANIPTDEETKSVALTYTEITSIKKEDWDRYWIRVSQTLKDVFGIEPEGNEQLKHLKFRVEVASGVAESKIEALPEMNESEQFEFLASVYHLDPFQIAADLAGVETVSAMQKMRYVELLRKMTEDTLEKNRYYFSPLKDFTIDEFSRKVPDDLTIQP